MYKVYGTVRSRAFRVLWTLEELGQPYELIAASPRSPEALAVNPSGKIPALQVGDDILTDSSAIMTYLADKHGALTFPAGTIDRARQDALMHQVLDEFDAVLWTAARHTATLPEDKRAPDVIETCKWEFERNAARLSDRLVGPFLMGDTMTIADLLTAHCLGWAGSAGFPAVDDKLRGYAKSMRARPSFGKVLALATS